MPYPCRAACEVQPAVWGRKKGSRSLSRELLGAPCDVSAALNHLGLDYSQRPVAVLHASPHYSSPSPLLAALVTPGHLHFTLPPSAPNFDRACRRLPHRAPSPGPLPSSSIPPYQPQSPHPASPPSCPGSCHGRLSLPEAVLPIQQSPPRWYAGAKSVPAGVRVTAQNCSDGLIARVRAALTPRGVRGCSRGLRTCS